jgi:hypothetical protein
MLKSITIPEGLVPVMKKEAVDFGTDFKGYIEHLVMIGRDVYLKTQKSKKKKK